MSDDVPARVAVLEAEIRHLNETVDRIATDVAAMKSTMDQAKGGWRVVLLVAGVSGAIGAGLAQLAAWLPPVPR